ncbi:MAG: endonuclease VII domain-containing protein [Pseudomonadota bacterium]
MIHAPAMPHKDPEAAKAYHAARRAKNREAAKAKTAQWREENPGRNAQNAKRWRDANPEKAAAAQKAWRDANREKVRQKQREWRERTGYNQKRKERGESTKQQLRLYGLTVEDYGRLLRTQGGVCAICASPEPGMKRASRLYVDHCHDTGRVRGLLCRACNTMLGCVQDKPELLRAGASYLERADDSGALCGAERGLLGSS